jgi:hypothetical protein
MRYCDDPKNERALTLTGTPEIMRRERVALSGIIEAGKQRIVAESRNSQ